MSTENVFGYLMLSGNKVRENIKAKENAKNTTFIQNINAKTIQKYIEAANRETDEFDDINLTLTEEELEFLHTYNGKK